MNHGVAVKGVSPEKPCRAKAVRVLGGAVGTCWSSASSPGGPVCGGAPGPLEQPPSHPPTHPLPLAGFSWEKVLGVSSRLAPLAPEGWPFPAPSLGLASPRTGPALAISAALRSDVCPAGVLSNAAPATTPTGACAPCPRPSARPPPGLSPGSLPPLGTVPFQAGLCDAVRMASRPALQRQSPRRPGGQAAQEPKVEVELPL